MLIILIYSTEVNGLLLYSKCIQRLALLETGHFYRPLTLCLNQKRFVSRFIIFFLLLLRLRVQQSFHKTLWEENHSSETTNKRLKWDKRLWRFFWQMGESQSHYSQWEQSPRSRTARVFKAPEQREVLQVTYVLLCHGPRLCHLSAPDKLSEMPPLIGKDSSKGTGPCGIEKVDVLRM